MAEDSNWGEDSLGVKIKKEKDKFMTLSADEKKEYFKSYYLVPTIIAIVVLAVAGLIVKDVFITKKTQVMQGIVINTEVSEAAQVLLTKDMEKILGAGDKKSICSFTSLHFTLVDGEPENRDFNNVMSLDTLLQAETVGYILCDKEGLEYVENLDVACDINDVLSKEQMNKISDRKIVAYSDNKKENIPIGINIYGTKIADALGLEEDDSNLVLIDKSRYVKKYEALVDYIMR